MSNDEAVAELKTILHTQGIRRMLIFLNGLTGHRFSALYQFENEQLRNLFFYDREDPTIESTDEIPVTASYCVFLRETGQLFHTSDAMRDARVRTHPKREKFRLTAASQCSV